MKVCRSSEYKKEIAPGALSHSSIFSLYKDQQGSIWGGTYYGGVNYFNPVYDIRLPLPSSLSISTVHPGRVTVSCTDRTSFPSS